MSGVKLLRELTNQGLKIFTTDQARQLSTKIGLKETGILTLIYRLKKAGWIDSLKKGVYYTTSDSGFGSPPHEFEMAMALVVPCAISHWTALHYHHLTQQTPGVVFAITPTNTPIPRKLPKRFRFVQIKTAYFFGLKKVWVGESRVTITDPERTLLDGLINPQYCGDFREVLHAFKMRGEDLDIDRIVGYALQLDVATSKRLGWVLDKLGYDSHKLDPLQKRAIKGVRRLDPTGPLAGPYNRRWMIQENIGGPN